MFFRFFFLFLLLLDLSLISFLEGPDIHLVTRKSSKSPTTGLITYISKFSWIDLLTIQGNWETLRGPSKYPPKKNAHTPDQVQLVYDLTSTLKGSICRYVRPKVHKYPTYVPYTLLIILSPHRRALHLHPILIWALESFSL